jgi:hypothetical protein
VRPHRNIAVLVLFAVAAGASWGTARALETPRPQTAAASCRSNPLVGVHDPQRLQILHACATFVGTVRRKHGVPPDGDLTFDVAPDPAYAGMLNAKNRSKGGIHMEIIPVDQAACTSDCSGARVAIPAVGARIRITGAHVYDRWVGWNEIHPTWKLEILSGRAAPPPPPPRPPVRAELKAALSSKGLARRGARHGRGSITLLADARGVCWRFTKLVRVGTPTRAAIRLREPGKRGRTVLELGKRYRQQGCAVADAAFFAALMKETSDYYVLVASKRHRHGAVRGRLIRVGAAGRYSEPE